MLRQTRHRRTQLERIAIEKDFECVAVDARRIRTDGRVPSSALGFPPSSHTATRHERIASASEKRPRLGSTVLHGSGGSMVVLSQTPSDHELVGAGRATSHRGKFR